MVRATHEGGTLRWLLEELGVPYELRRVEFRPPTRSFAQQTPLGKLPVIEDDGVTIGESGAIVEYVLERYGAGRLAPPIGLPHRGPFLQWLHFAEATAFPPLGVLVWHLVYQGDADANPGAMDGARERAAASLAVVERALATDDYLVGNTFSAADVMMGSRSWPRASSGCSTRVSHGSGRISTAWSDARRSSAPRKVDRRPDGAFSRPSSRAGLRCGLMRETVLA